VVRIVAESRHGSEPKLADHSVVFHLGVRIVGGRAQPADGAILTRLAQDSYRVLLGRLKPKLLLLIHGKTVWQRLAGQVSFSEGLAHELPFG
jgi:hypothetical protein